MNASELGVLAKQIADGLCGPHEQLRVILLRLLAQGSPLSLERLATAAGTSVASVAGSLDHYPDIERDAAGNIVGWGLSLRPTAHQFCLGTTTLWTWCAFDTLMYPALLEHTARVTTICPITQAPIRFVVHPDAIVDVDPPGAVVSLVPPSAICCKRVRASFCTLGHAFVDADAAAIWQATKPAAMLLPIVAAHQIASYVAHERLSRARGLAVVPRGEVPGPRVR